MRKLFKTAFTLIELLVVIAIIGILSGLIVVTMNGITDKANIAKSQVFSNSLRNALMANLVSEWKLDQVNYPTANQTPDTWGGKTGTLLGSAGPQNLPQFQDTGCVYGGCLLFDGDDDYVQTTLSVGSQVNDMTVEAWIYSLAPSGSSQAIFAETGSWTAGSRLYFNDVNSLMRFIVFNGTMYDGFEVTAPFSGYNKWTHIAASFQYVSTGNSPMKMYINGVLKNSVLRTNGTPNPTTDNAQIGVWGNTSYNFNGKIDNVRVYNCAISSFQVKENYYAGLNNLLISGNISKDDYFKRVNQMAYGE
jgi:prepilin-type N-terminal cleavage/methylation domain-containing protein